MTDKNRLVTETRLPEIPYPNSTYAWWVVTILVVALLVSFVDRQIVALVVEPMKEDLNINDVQAGWLYGGFAIFYAIAGLPIARLADTKSRKLIIIIGIFLWSIMTLMAGLARNFTQLFITRIGVGVGEASLGPSTHSLVGDYFPREKIPLALSVFQVGAVVGSGLAFWLGGMVVELVQNSPPIELPVFGTVPAWQMTFIYVGAPGLLVVLLMMTVREPHRRFVKPDMSTGNSISMTEILAFYRLNWATFVTHHVGFAMLALVGYAFVFWTPTFFSRVHGVPAGEASQVFGLIFMTFGSLGVVWAAIVAQRLSEKKIKDANIIAGMLGGLGAVITLFIVQLMPDKNWAYVMYAPAMFFINSPFGVANGAIPVITPPNMRAQVAAVNAMFGAFFGMALGPVAAGFFNEYVFTGPDGIRYSLMAMASSCGVVGLSILWIGRKHYAVSMRRADSWSV